jgi:Phage integrase, N-terminal SAM-like domain
MAAAEQSSESMADDSTCVPVRRRRGSEIEGMSPCSEVRSGPGRTSHYSLISSRDPLSRWPDAWLHGVMQLQESLQAFLLQLSADGRSPHTIGQYRRHVTSLIDWVTDNGAGANVADLAPEVLAKFFSHDAAKKSCRGGPKKAVSLNAMRTSIRCFCAHLRDAGLVSANPARLLRRARCAPPPPKALHADEQERLLDVLAAATGPEAERDRMLGLIESHLGTERARVADADDPEFARPPLRSRPWTPQALGVDEVFVLLRVETPVEFGVRGEDGLRDIAAEERHLLVG